MKQYLHKIKRGLVYIGVNEMRYLKSFKKKIIDELGESASYNELVYKYGEPSEIAEIYLEREGVQSLNKKRNTWLILSIISLFSIILILSLLFKSYWDGKQSYIDKETIIIKEE